ncbi:ATP-binding cassette domain-containing protein [Peribacillus frigoritolerans]|nr:ATP-binding cassette domain-containing protein [Peribacillus frigoritolerans]
MGPLGSGKSTLLNVLSSLDIPSDGDIKVGELLLQV